MRAEHSYPATASMVPLEPQFKHRRAGTPWVTLNASSLVDAGTAGEPAISYKGHLCHPFAWFMGPGSSCNPKASPHSPHHHCACGSSALPAWLQVSRAGKGLTGTLKL